MNDLDQLSHLISKFILFYNTNKSHIFYRISPYIYIRFNRSPLFHHFLLIIDFTNNHILLIISQLALLDILAWFHILTILNLRTWFYILFMFSISMLVLNLFFILNYNLFPSFVLHRYFVLLNIIYQLNLFLYQLILYLLNIPILLFQIFLFVLYILY